ncbi:MAG TPA: TerC family protein [Polyangiaceae bacterium]
MDPHINTVGTPALWAGFVGFVLAMLALDLGVFHRRAHAVSVREALTWTLVWVSLSSLFCLGIYAQFGSSSALEFATGYLIEKALAVDNIFVFAVVFQYFGVPAKDQHRVLFWGILGALVMRAIFIALGTALLARFHWILYLFGAALVAAGIKLFLQRQEAVNPAERAIVRWFRHHVPMTSELRGSSFAVQHEGRWMATPLLLVLLVIEVSDLVFALDSIPAIFAVTLDPFIVFTSNIFAILGLRSMYFLLAGIIDRFRYLKVGLAAVLCFVGAKMLLADVYAIPTVVSLCVVAALLAVSIGASAIDRAR